MQEKSSCYQFAINNYGHEYLTPFANRKLSCPSWLLNCPLNLYRIHSHSQGPANFEGFKNLVPCTRKVLQLSNRQHQQGNGWRHLKNAEVNTTRTTVTMGRTKSIALQYFRCLLLEKSREKSWFTKSLNVR